VTVPVDSLVSIFEGPAELGAPTGFVLLDPPGEQSNIDVTPGGTVLAPLVLTFSVYAPGTPSSEVEVIKGDDLDPTGTVVLDCNNPGGTSADPDPCVESRTPQGDDNTVVVVRTSTASGWGFSGWGFVESEDGSDCKCQVKNIFPGGQVANIRIAGKPFMYKTLGAEINAVDRIDGSGLCPDDPEGPYKTAEAVVSFLVTDEAGNILSNGVPQTATCISGLENPIKSVVRFGPESCGPDGFTVGLFEITTSVSGEAGYLERKQKIRCRP
jgi:hypothetical protein